MKTNENGVKYESSIYFYSPTSQAKNAFMHCICTGHFFCDNTYYVDRQNYNSFLILYVKNGSGFVKLKNQECPVNSGDFVFIDCYNNHSYYTNSGWEIYWIHFDGPVCREYYNIATSNSNIFTFKDENLVAQCLIYLYNIYNEHKTVSEVVVSKNIDNLLTNIIERKEPSCKIQNVSTDRLNSIEEILRYISENACSIINVEQVARKAFFSPSYFNKLFKEETSYTPHQYIILCRINYAKYLLKTTKLSTEEISYQCGYNNVCSFCSLFKKHVGLSPLKFRNKN